MEKAKFILEDQVLRERSLVKNVYLWMTGGLALTGVVSMWMMADHSRIVSLVQSGLFWPILIGEFVLVFVLSSRIMKMRSTTAALIFTAYSILNGVTLSTIFIMYTSSSLTSTFFITAGTFAAMSLYAATTKRNLAGIGNYLFMGLLGIIIASVVNIFLKSPGMYYIISYAGVLIFCGLTAYDTQAILKMSREYSSSNSDNDHENYVKLSIIGALKLYLDFVNMFIFFLRIFGRRN